MHLRILIFILFSVHFVHAQETVLEVVTKKIGESFAYYEGDELFIQGEKAEIEISTWEKPNIEVTLELISKHPVKDIATEDLERLMYVTERIGKKIYLKNYIALSSGDLKPESNLRAKYSIKLPTECPVFLETSFGKAHITDLSHSLEVKSKFSNIAMENVAGSVDIQSRYGDIIGRGMDGLIKIESNRSNITLKEIKGKYDINAKYGVIKIFAFDSLIDLNINAEKSEVEFFMPKNQELEYALNAKYGNIKLPDNAQFNWTENSKQWKQATLKRGSEMGSISISVSFGGISVYN